MLASIVGKGLAAGAAGTTALNAVTYADMALRGRPTSELPERAVTATAERLGQDVPGEGEARQNRLTGLGALAGIATGLTIGTVAAFAAPVLRRVSFPAAAVALGAAAMAGSDAPMAALGLTDPKKWSAADWASDALPHLAYGVAAAWTLRALPPGRARAG
jgi:hypothetical protein